MTAISAVYLVLIVLAIIIIIAWIFLPIAVFGMKTKIEELVREARGTNKLLDELLQLLRTTPKE